MKNNAIYGPSVILITLATYILIFFISDITIAQENLPPNIPHLMEQDSANYYDIVDSLDSYFENNEFSNEEMQEDDKIFSKASRWVQFWESKTSCSSLQLGSPQPYINGIVNYSQNYLQTNCGTNNSDWSLIGPQVRPYTDIGVVIAVARHPTNPDIMYVGNGHGGVWKTTNATAVWPIWSNVTDKLNLPTISITDIRIDPNNGNTIWASTGNTWGGGYSLGVLKSVDGGDTWTFPISYSTVGSSSQTSFKKILIDPSNSNKVFALTEKEIHYTSNGGVSWIKLSPLTRCQLDDMHFSPTSNSELIVSCTGQIWKASTNNVWTNLTTVNTPLSTVPPLISVANGNIYAMFKTGTNQVLEKSTNNGSSWLFLNNVADYGVRFIVSPSNENIIYIRDNPKRRVAKSINRGVNFSNVTQYYPDALYHGVSTHADIRDMELLTSSSDGLSDELLVGCDGGILFSSSASVSGTTPIVNWIPLNGFHLAITEFHGIDVLGYKNVIVGGTQDNNAYTYKDKDWTRWSFGDNFDVEIIDNATYDTYVQYNHPGLTKGTNFGLGSVSSGNEPPFCNPLSSNSCNWNSSSSWWKYPTSPIEELNGTLYVGRKDMFKKVGNSWVAISDFSTKGVSDQPLRVFAIAPSNPNVMYAAYGIKTYGLTPSKILFRTTDGGTNWTDISASVGALKWALIEDIMIDPTDASKVYLAFDGVWYDPSYPNDESKGHNRIWHSIDNGNSWSSFTEGLPVFGVNRLLFQKSYPNCMYAATDVGVFYRTGDMNQWECFQNNFPYARVTDLEINNCSEKLIAATGGRGIWESPLAVPLPSTSNTFSGGNHSLSSNEFIEHKTIKIESGATLTLQNMTLYLRKDAKIIIKPGGHLILDSATLTNECGEQWQGIEVWGNSSATQFPDQVGNYAQGRLTTKNGSVIENAREAIRVWKHNDWNSTGGIVQAHQTTFRNNASFVKFMSYENHYPPHFPTNLANKITNNRSYFTECTFIHDSDPQNGMIAKNMVTLYQVRGISFNGCTFQHNYNVNKKIAGIYTLNADFEVQDYCPGGLSPCSGSTIIKSKFVNLPQGVVATNSCEYRSFQVHGAEFTDCNDGIIFDGVDDAFIVNNTFNYTQNQPLVAIYGNNSGRYTIENNSIGSSQKQLSYGIVIANSGGGYNELYRNTISNTKYAIYSMGKNFEFNPTKLDKGLKFICNSMNFSFYNDISCKDLGAGQLQGEYDPNQQGFVSAKNSFTLGLSANNNKYHYLQLSTLKNTVMYYGSNNSGSTIYKPTALNSTNFVLASYNRSCNNNFPSNSSPSKRVLVKRNGQGSYHLPSDVKADFTQHFYDYNLAYNNYNQVMNGGSEAQRLADITNNNNFTPDQLKVTMINNSPLSKTVLLALINSYILSNDQINEVLSVNTHAGREREITTILNESPYSFSQEKINSIVALGEQTTIKDEMEGEMAFYTGNWSYPLGQLINYYSTDTIIEPDTLNNLFSLVPSYNYHLSKAMSFQTVGDNSTAENLIVNAESLISMTEDEINQNQVLNDLLPEYNTQFISSDPWNFTSTFRELLIELEAKNLTRAGTYAKNLLRFEADTPYIVNIEEPGTGGSTRLKSPETTIQNTHPPILKAYPIPAQNAITFEWDNLDHFEAPVLVIYSLEGREVYKGRVETSHGEFDLVTTSFGSGLYLYSLMDQDQVILSGKISINH